MAEEQIHITLPADLSAYAAAGVGSEHESTTFAEAAEKARAGLAILVREGSAAHNLTTIVRGLLDSGIPTDRFMFCTDDKHLEDLRRRVLFALIGVVPIFVIAFDCLMAESTSNRKFSIRTHCASSAFTSYCGSTSEVSPTISLKTLVLMFAAIRLFADAAEPNPSAEKVVSGFTCRTLSVVSGLKICGVTLYEY